MWLFEIVVDDVVEKAGRFGVVRIKLGLCLLLRSNGSTSSQPSHEAMAGTAPRAY